MGDIDGGHYFTYFRKSDRIEKWYKANDQRVEVTSADEVLVTQFAYVLFYEQQVTGYFSNAAGKQCNVIGVYITCCHKS